MNFKRMMLVLVFFLVSGKFVFAQQEGVVQSSFTETGYFAAVEGIEGYQWMTDFESKSISYAVSLEIVKPFNKKVFAEIYFENPEDKSKPIIQEKVIGPLDKEMLVLSPPVLGLRRNAYYDLTILIYADTQKTELITKYADKIKAYMDGRYFGEIEEILGYALANDYDTAHDILKWRMKYSRTFIIESALRVLDDFKKGILDEDYVQHFSQGLQHHLKGDFKGGIEQFKKAVSLVNGYPEGYIFLGIEYISLDQGKEAIPYLEKCLELKSDYAQAYWGLGSVYGQLGFKDREKEYLLKARDIFEMGNDRNAVIGINNQLNREADNSVDQQTVEAKNDSVLIGDKLQTFYFPEYGVRVSAPFGWNARNESHRGLGYIMITKEKITDADSIYLTGVAIYTNIQTIFVKKFTNTFELSTAFISLGETSRLMTNPHRLVTSIGEFDAYDLHVNNNIESVQVQAALITNDNSYIILYESPRKTWDLYKPILEKIIKNIEWNTKAESEDLIIRSITKLDLSE